MEQQRVDNVEASNIANKFRKKGTLAVLDALETAEACGKSPGQLCPQIGYIWYIYNI